MFTEITSLRTRLAKVQEQLRLCNIDQCNTEAQLAEAEALLRDIKSDLDIDAHPRFYKDHIDAFLARETKP